MDDRHETAIHCGISKVPQDSISVKNSPLPVSHEGGETCCDTNRTTDIEFFKKRVERSVSWYVHDCVNKQELTGI